MLSIPWPIDSKSPYIWLLGIAYADNYWECFVPGPGETLIIHFLDTDHVPRKEVVSVQCSKSEIKKVWFQLFLGIDLMWD